MSKQTSSHETAREDVLMPVHRALRQLTEAAQTARDRAAKSQGLHPTDFACIGYLYGIGKPVSPKQISEHLNLSSGSGTALLDRLESAGYTRRLPNPEDRRSLLIELDLDGAESPIRRIKELELIYREVMEQFSDSEIVIATRFIEAIAAFANKLT